MGHSDVWNSHPKDHGKGSRQWCAACFDFLTTNRQAWMLNELVRVGLGTGSAELFGRHFLPGMTENSFHARSADQLQFRQT